jgi:hypothetical protein
MAKADNVHSTPPPHSTTDPIYLAIERHKNAVRLWAAAVEVSAAFPDGANPMMLEQQAQIDAAVAGARFDLIDCGLDLIEIRPTTIGGIIAALEHIRDQLQGADTMPPDVLLDTPVGATAGWLAVFVGVLADAAGDILARHETEGGA